MANAVLLLHYVNVNTKSANNNNARDIIVDVSFYFMFV